jgi:hypothetical protein
MTPVAAIWQWFVPSPAAVWGLYRTDREYSHVHDHTRRQSLRVALWWERRARREWVAYRKEEA